MFRRKAIALAIVLITFFIVLLVLVYLAIALASGRVYIQGAGGVSEESGGLPVVFTGGLAVGALGAISGAVIAISRLQRQPAPTVANPTSSTPGPKSAPPPLPSFLSTYLDPDTTARFTSQANDTIRHVAEAYQVSLEDIYQANPGLLNIAPDVPLEAGLDIAVPNQDPVEEGEGPVVEMQKEPDVQEEGKGEARVQLYVDPSAVTLIGDGREPVSILAAVFTTDPTTGLARPDKEANRTIQMTVDRTDLLILKVDQAPTAFGRQATLRTSGRVVGDEPMTATVHATARAADEILDETIQVTLRPLRPELKLEAGNETLVADGVSTVQIRAQVLLYSPDGILLDVDAEATPRIQFAVEPTELYTLKPSESPMRGQVQVSLRTRELRTRPLLPANFVARVTAGSARRTERLTINPEPATLDLEVIPSSLELIADGQDSVELKARVIRAGKGDIQIPALQAATANVDLTLEPSPSGPGLPPAILTLRDEGIRGGWHCATLSSNRIWDAPLEATILVGAVLEDQTLDKKTISVRVKPVEPAGALDIPAAEVRLQQGEKVEKEPVIPLPEEPIEEASGGKMPSTWVCTNCGVENREEMCFCTKCGMPKSAEVFAWTCAKCGAKNREGMRFCTKCGAMRPQEAAAEWICPHCQKLNAAQTSFCTGCGRRRGEGR